jgi:hypothetical protein
MIDPQSGALLLVGVRLEPGLTRAHLLASSHGRDASTAELSNGWTRVDLGTHALGVATFKVSVSFEGARLDGYTLVDVDPRFGSAWEEWSEKTERARRKAHDAWLLAALGPADERRPGLRYARGWGEAWSTLDPREGAASIGVRFHKTGRR